MQEIVTAVQCADIKQECKYGPPYDLKQMPPLLSRYLKCKCTNRRRQGTSWHLLQILWISINQNFNELMSELANSTELNTSVRSHTSVIRVNAAPAPETAAQLLNNFSWECNYRGSGDQHPDAGGWDGDHCKYVYIIYLFIQIPPLAENKRIL